MIVHWWDVSKNRLVDGGLKSPNTPLRLRSEHHYQPPGSYEINRLVPKILRKVRRKTYEWVTTIDAVPATQPPSSVYWSAEDWALRDPVPQNIENVFQASALDQLGQHIVGKSALIRSGRLSINEEIRSRRFRGVLGALVHVFHLVAGAEVSRTQTWVLNAPVDPAVEISLMQGGELLGHLREVSAHFGEHGADDFSEILGPNGATYFVDGPSPAMPDLSQRVVCDVGPGLPVTIEVQVGRSETLRTAYAVRLQDLESGYVTISDPVFLTAIQGNIIRTHLPMSLLSQAASDVLRAFAEANGDVNAVAKHYGSTVETAWDDLVSAMDELGADSVYEAATFASEDVQSAVPATLFGLARGLNRDAGGIDTGPSPADAALAADLALPVEELNLTVRSYNCLKRAGIDTVAELVARSEQDLLDVGNFGAKSIEEVRQKLADMGLALRDSAAGFDPGIVTDSYGVDDESHTETEQY